MTVSHAPVMGSLHHPESLTFRKADKTLVVTFEDGRVFELPAELLRVESPSAEVQGHSPGEKTLVAGRAHVGIIAVEPVGSYAVRLVFDDLHDSGLYTWDYLYELGENRDLIWRQYLANIEAQGLSRYPDGAAPAPKTCGCGKTGGCGG